MIEHLLTGLSAFFSNPVKLSLFLLVLAAALLISLKLKDSVLSLKKRIFLIYTHLFLLSFAFVYVALSLSCAEPSFLCPVTLTQTGLYSFPIAVLLSLAAGFFLFPWFAKFGAKKISGGALADFVNAQSFALGIKSPALYSIDSQKPYAFSALGFKPVIFVSIGMQELLSEREVQAVLLHELSHVASSAPAFKLSANLVSLFSPFHSVRAFHAAFESEEARADEFACRMQGTKRFVNSAKKKIDGFFVS